MSSSFSGPGNPNDQLFGGEADLEISGPPVPPDQRPAELSPVPMSRLMVGPNLPPDQLSAQPLDGLTEEEAQESGAAAGGRE